MGLERERRYLGFGFEDHGSHDRARGCPGYCRWILRPWIESFWNLRRRGRFGIASCFDRTLLGELSTLFRNVAILICDDGSESDNEGAVGGG